MKEIRIIEENRISDGYLKIDEALVSQKEKDGTYKNYIRYRIDRPDAVVVLLYNPQKDIVVLVRQFRYPVVEEILRVGGNLQTGVIEAVAGKIDPGEKPKETALREVREEVGYNIKEKDLIPLSRGYSSPGYSSEIIYNFAAIVTDKDKVSKGGGKEDEFEDIDIIEMPYLQFRSLVESGSLTDMKTRLVYYEASYAGLFKNKRVIPKVPKKDRAKLQEGVDKKSDTQFNLYDSQMTHPQRS